MKKVLFFAGLIFALALIFNPFGHTSQSDVEQIPIENIDAPMAQFFEIEQGLNLENCEDNSEVTPNILSDGVNYKVLKAQPPTDESPPGDATFFQNVVAWVTNNLAEFILLLLAFMKGIVNLTPTEKDNKWYDIIERFFNAIFPNKRAKSLGGGRHPT